MTTLRLRGFLLPVAAIVLMLAMIALSLTGQSIAGHRTRLAALDRQIADTHRDIAALNIDLSRRGRLDQVARWNRTLGLVQPDSTHYLPTIDSIEGRAQHGPVLLASAAP